MYVFTTHPNLGEPPDYVVCITRPNRVEFPDYKKFELKHVCVYDTS